MVAKFGARAGAAAFVLGLSVAGPAGFAAADTPDSESGSAQAAAGESAVQTAPARSTRANKPSRSRTRGPAPSATSERLPREPGERAVSTGDVRPDNPAPAAATRPAGLTAAARSSVSAPTAAATRRPVTAALGSAAAVGNTDRPERSAVVPVAPAASVTAASPQAAASGASNCAACWGAEAPSIAAAVTTAVNHAFNSAFDWLASLPANPISDLVGGALVLIRRALFLVPEGVTVTQTTPTSLSVSVNTGSVAYFRHDGTTLQISGDPWFFGAQSYDDTAGLDVSVTNTGNAGCAGMVLTSGTVNGDLTTSQIDSIRFGTGAAFTDKVTASVSGGPLTLRDAVRGLTGVELRAPVVLASDVEIDAGTKNAFFGGTVDGTAEGTQSLTVTALGTTTFDAAVGGQVPLASLLTRAVTPLDIRQSANTTTIPLHYMPEYSTSGQLQVKYGIDVAIGANHSRTFVFDTGGNGFFAGYNPDYFTGVTLTDEQVDIVYTSGNYYDAVVANAVVTIGPEGGPRVSTVRPVQIGAILQGGNQSDGQVFDFTNPFAPPVDGRFSGDFGAAFGVQPSDNGETGLSSVLFQLPGNLSTGFLVQLGPIGIDPQLTVGITDELRDQFPYAIPVSALSGGGTYPVSGYQVLQQFGFSPQYFVSSPEGLLYPLGTEQFQQCAVQCLPSLIDSGAPSTSVRLPGAPTPFPLSTANNSALQPGSTFIAQFPTTQGRPPLEWTFVAGSIGSVNAVGYDDQSGAATTTQNVNTGLNLYNGYDVMFDTQKQVIWLRPNGGQSTVNLQSVTTTGDQSYQQNAVLSGSYATASGDFSVSGVTDLAADTTINAGSGAITFSGTVDGPHALTVNSTGATHFVRGVGQQIALTRLTTDAGGSTSTAGVTTQDGQTYGDTVTLNGAYQVNDGEFTVAGAATLAGQTSISTTGGDITFVSTVDATPGQGFTLRLVTDGGHTQLSGAVGAVNPLGGIGMANTAEHTVATVTAAGTVAVNGSLGYAGSSGLFIGDSVTADFSHGGTITDFTTSGVVFEGSSTNSTISNFTISDNVYDGIQIAAAAGSVPYDFTGTQISDNTIYGNSAFGIETLAPVSGLTISGNTIGKQGTSNPWGYVSDGPNAHGVVLAPGNYAGSSISGNVISHNMRSAIFAPGGVKGLDISGNTLSDNGTHGIEFVTGDFAGTDIQNNVIRSNGADGISLGAGIGQGTRTPGINPLVGYTTEGGRYLDAHYVLPYANNPDFYSEQTPPPDPTIQMRVGTKQLEVNLDTGSRGLYFDEASLDPNVLSQGTVLGTGHVYLNSSNRLYFGDWVQLPVTFTQSYFQTAGGQTDTSRKAVATMPVLVVQAIGASTTPAPGQTQASTTFNTTIDSGFVTITNSAGDTQQAPIVLNPNDPGTGIVTIPGGYWANYADNVGKLAPVANFGVGFDRSGQGTAPTDNGVNQVYNAFLNLTEMQNGTMRPGYVMTAQGVTLGLDSTVSGYAYTDLAPTGLAQGAQTAPDWQPATGTITAGSTTYGVGQIVLDMGYGGGILTLPGYAPPGSFTQRFTVNLLDSNGAVRYDVDPSEGRTNLMNPESIDLFNPLAGNYSQNTPPLSQQFFNTGRPAFAGFDYLFDAGSGYLGLAQGRTQQAADALASANGLVTPGYYQNATAPTGVRNLTIKDNTIADNGGAGVGVNGAGSVGNAVLTNSIYSNVGQGISLTNGANGGQPAPESVVANRVADGVTVQGTMPAVPGYSGNFTVQVFRSPATDAGNVEGRQYLGAILTAAGQFQGQLQATGLLSGDWITLTATPVQIPNNTSQFSVPVQIEV